MQNSDKRAVSAIRVLAAETVQKANSGHPGMAIGAAPIAYTIWKNMKHNPADPKWAARDRFVLSSGHASALEYSLLHLFGYGLSIEDMKSFRQLDSLTPGHPEYGHTVGVEATTGPLGQGFAMAVGMAMAEERLAAQFNREGFPIVDNYTYVLMGDGCMMEGISSEAASFAGSMKLGRLVAFYDSNRITIEGGTDVTFTEDVGARFAAFGWQVLNVQDGEDMDAIAAAMEAAKAETAKPSLIIVKTEIAYGTTKSGTAASHGEPLGQPCVDDMKARLGWDYAPFEVPGDVYEHFAALRPGFESGEEQWRALFAAYGERYPELAAQWDEWHSDKAPELDSPEFTEIAADSMATRAASGELLNRLAKRLPNLFGGSADLAPSNKTVLKGVGYFGAEERGGSNLHFGVRELAMAAMCNGVMLYGGLRAYCATFFVFADYVKPALRLAAIMGLPVLYVLTHDSIGVGEDGPTHQPIEQLAMLRSTPNVLVFRPADSRETAYGYMAALSHRGPSVLALTRQNLPKLEKSGSGALKGGYVVYDSEAPQLILMAAGSEVEPAISAAKALADEGVGARVVSMPSFELFDAQDAEYRESVLPRAIRARVAVEAGASFGWHKYVGLDGEVVAIDHFGASAPAKQVFKACGITAENVAAAARRVLGR